MISKGLRKENMIGSHRQGQSETEGNTSVGSSKEIKPYLKVKWKNMTALTTAMTVTMATSMPYTQIHLASL